MEFAEYPEGDSKACQKSREDPDPRKYETPIAGMAIDITIVSRTRDVEPMKAEETAAARCTAVDFAAHHKCEVFPSAMCAGAHHLSLATRARAVCSRSPHRFHFTVRALRPAIRMATVFRLVIARGNQFRYRHQRPLIRRCRELANNGSGFFREGLCAFLRTLDPAMAM